LSLYLLRDFIPAEGFIVHNLYINSLSFIYLLQQLVLALNLEVDHLAWLLHAVLHLIYVALVVFMDLVLVAVTLQSAICLLYEPNSSRLVEIKLEPLQGIVQH